jgi:hypothetical protein
MRRSMVVPLMPNGPSLAAQRCVQRLLRRVFGLTIFDDEMRTWPRL